MTRLHDKVIIVTGAGSGIGAYTAEAMVRAGARMVVADIEGAAVERVAHSIHAAVKNAEVRAIRVDMSEEASIKAMIDFTVATFGGLNVLFNNAAATQFAQSRDGTLEQMDTEVWDYTMHVNLRGPMHAIKYSIPHLRAARGGSIINMSSGAAFAGALAPSAYGVSKAAIGALTLYAATQLGKESIRCNTIAPGLILTPATQASYAAGQVGQMMLRHQLTPYFGTPQDIACVAIWLASDESRYVTGQVIQVDGGALAHQPYHADALAMQQQSG